METESNEGDEGVIGRSVVRVCASCTGAEAGRMLLLSLSIKSFMLSSLYREKKGRYQKMPVRICSLSEATSRFEAEERKAGKVRKKSVRMFDGE